MVHPSPSEDAPPDPLTSANLSRIASHTLTVDRVRSRASGTTQSIGRHQDRAPFSRKLTRSLFFRPAHLVGTPPGYAQSLKSALTYSVVNVLLVFNPVAWALHFTNQSTTATFACALLGIVPLAGLLGHGTETVALYTGDALGGLINASLGNATEFIIAILLLLKCELRVVQASLLGGLLSNLLLVTGMAFLVGGFRFNEQEFQQTAAQLNTSLMTLAVIALVLPTVFAFAIEQASGEDQERRLILEMSRGASLILILIYVLYMVFQLYSHSYLYNPDAEYEIRSDSSSSSSSSTRSASPAPDTTQPTTDTKVDSDVMASGDGTVKLGEDAKVGTGSSKVTPEPQQLSPVAEIQAQDLSIPTSSQDTTTDPHIARPTASAATTPIPPSPSPRPNLITARSNLRRTNSLPFGSAAALGRGSRHPIVPGKSWREIEKRMELESRYGRGEMDSGRMGPPAYVPRTPGYGERTPRVAFDVERHGDGMESRSTITAPHVPETPEMNMVSVIVLLLVTTGLTYLTAEALTDALEEIGNGGSVSKEWLGLILLAVVGNAAEHVTAVFVAYRNKVDLALAVSVGSSIQIALFVIPLLVMISWAIGKPLSLLFDPLEVVTLFLSVLLVRFATEDGRTHYMSGITLFGSYILIAYAFWYYPNTGTAAGKLFDEACRT